MAVNRAMRDVALAGPADAYHVKGSLSLITRTRQCSLSELATWLREEERLRPLVVMEGPFVDDPKAAVNVAIQSLAQASQACLEVSDALERAHITLAQVSAEQFPAQGTGARRTLRRRRRA